MLEWCERKELIDKGVCDTGFIWNPSNCQCECDKLCDVGEYLYENCKCRKKLVDKLVEECTETVEEVKIAKMTLAGTKISINGVLAQLYHVILNNFYNQHWNCYLFCLFSSVLKKRCSTCWV